DGGGVDFAAAADEDDAGGQGICAGTNHSPGKLRSHRPCAGKGKASLEHGFKERFPASAGGAGLTLSLGLLEGVVDGDREGRMCLLRKIFQRFSHSVEEKGFRFRFAPMAVRRSNQLLGLRYR